MQPVLTASQRHTWNQAAIRWLRETSHKVDHKNDIARLRWLDKFFADFFLDQITRDVVELVIDAKLLEASASTVNRYLAMIRSILRMACDHWEWIQRVPRIRMLREPKRRVRWLKPEEASNLLRELPPHLRAMAVFSLATGLRQRNVSYLRWDQVDLGRGMAWIYADQTKARTAIAVPLTDHAIAIIRAQIGINPEWVFTYKGKPVDRTSTKAWKSALKRAGIENFRWHDLRHTWASWHAQNGTTMQQLMELGGWASMEMVLRYAHFSGEHLKAAARNVQSAFDQF